MAIRCFHCGRSHLTTDEVRRCSQTRRLRTKTDVERVLAEEIAVPFDDLLDAIAISRGDGDLELLDRVVDYALKSVTGEVPDWKWKPVVVEAARRLIANTDFEHLASTASNGASELRSRLNRYHTQLHDEIEVQARTLDEVAVLLADSQASSLVSVCSRLRRLARPDLGRIAATRAIELDPRVGAARTTRAAAILDVGKPQEAIADLNWIAEHDPSFYSANVWSRAEQMQGRYSQARSWAELANQRDPDGIAGMLSLAKVAAVTGDHQTAEWAFMCHRQATGTSLSVHYPAFVAARDLHLSGSRDEAIAVLTQLAESDYAPARRFLLEHYGYKP